MSQDREILILDQLLNKLKIYDIQLSYDASGVLQAKDAEGNSWAGKEFYRFLTEECLCFQPDGQLAEGQYVPDEVLAPYKQLSVENGVIPGQSEPRYPRYFDMNGKEIHPGMSILMESGTVERVYETSDEFGHPDLGISATNDAFLRKHPGWEQEFYPLSSIGLSRVEVCLSETEIRAELYELEGFIQGTELARDYNLPLPEGDLEKYEAAITRRTRLETMLRINEKPESDVKEAQKTIPKERGDAR